MNYTRINGEVVNLDLVRHMRPKGDRLFIAFDAGHELSIVCANNYAPSLLCDELYSDIRRNVVRTDYNG